MKSHLLKVLLIIFIVMSCICVRMILSQRMKLKMIFMIYGMRLVEEIVLGGQKIGVGVNVREGENVGIYGLKKEHTLEDFKRVKKMLEKSNKRINNHFLKNESLTVGHLERQIYFNNLVNHKTIENIYFYLDCLNNFKLFNGKKYIV